MLQESAKNLCMLKYYRLKLNASKWIDLQTVLSLLGIALMLNMLLKYYEVSLVVGPAFAYLCSKLVA